MDIGTLSWLVTICVFGTCGWLLASRRRSRSGPKAFGLLLGTAVAGYYVGVSTILFGIDGFRIFLNWAIVAACAGACLGLALRNRRLRQAAGA